MTAKARGIDAEREKEKRILTLNSIGTRYLVDTSKRIKKKKSKTGQNRPKSAILDKIMSISRNVVCTNSSRKTLRVWMYEMKRLPWSIPKVHTQLQCCKIAFCDHVVYSKVHTQLQCCKITFCDNVVYSKSPHTTAVLQNRVLQSRLIAIY